MEILVVMIISTIVISLAFVILGMVQKQISVIKKTIETKENIQQLEHWLWNDFNNFSSISYQDSQLFFKHEIDSVVYKIDNGYIIRNEDSLLLPLNNIVLYLDGKKVKSGGIDATEVQFNNPYNLSRIFVFSTKDARYYMNK